MATDEVETVREWHHALNAGDVERLLALSSDDVEVGGPRGSGRGAPLLREWFGRASIHMEPARTFHRENVVVVEQRAVWRPAGQERAAGQEMATAPQTVASVFVVKDGRVASVFRYPDLAAALAASGLTYAEEDAVAKSSSPVIGSESAPVGPVETSIAPWLAVRDGADAVEYYRRALGAVEVYQLEGDDGKVVVAQLAVGGAAFWIQEDDEASLAAQGVGKGRPVRMILTVDDPDALFARAVAAGATPIAPVHEEHGWRSGRVIDPFGHDWEFAKPLSAAGH